MNNKYYGCIKCDAIFQGNQCACGWKLPDTKTVQYKHQGYKETHRGNPGAFKYMTTEQKNHIKKLWDESPKQSEGNLKIEVANYWIYHIGKINKGFSELLRKRGFGNV